MIRMNQNHHKSNPFATRFTRPGEIEFLFSAGDSLADLVTRIQQRRQWQILGDHGTGKTTLVNGLIREIEMRSVFKRAERITLRDRQRKLPLNSSCWSQFDQHSLLVIDGFEQLSWLQKRRTLRKSKQRDCTLLVTTHRDLGIETLFHCRSSLETARAIVSRLCPEIESVDGVDIPRLLEKHGNNLRELLFELYDVWNKSFRS